VDKTNWNLFVCENSPKSGRFLQSWEWGEFQRAVGERVERIVYEKDGCVFGVAQWVHRKVGIFGKYVLCQKGPIVLNGADLKRPFFDSVFFSRIEPNYPISEFDARKTLNLNPADTLITDLSRDEDELFSAMHPKTRYNIRVAKRHGVEIDFDARELDEVWKLFSQTAARGKFRLHAKKYYKTMLDELRDKDCRAFLAVAKKGGKILAANIVVDFGDTRTYLHGASSDEDRNAMAPYLLHWELMRDAKACGLRFYDWWGVAPVEAENHPWFGISRFKRGFGGEEVGALGTFDIVAKPVVYYFYRVARRVVKIARYFYRHP
jgi:lipid II:glycine glycyltransferase (peptidoglycan interpeptide bridge formation enzyme)